MTALNIETTVTLNNGIAMPRLGLGTWKAAEGGEVESAVRHALDVGYRHIDTAAAYDNEEGVGKAVRDSGIPREHIFVTTKIPNPAQRSNGQAAAFDASMRKLDIDYIDLLLIHWPVPGKFVDTWKIMEDIRARGDGKLRSIGVSNFLKHHLEEVMAASNTVPAVNQVEFHPWLVMDDLLRFCHDNKIQHEAWSPLMQGKCTDVRTLVEIGRQYDKSPAQVVLRWDLQKGTVTIPKSTNAKRIEENAALFDFELSDEDMKRIDALDRNERLGPDPDNFGF